MSFGTVREEWCVLFLVTVDGTADLVELLE